MATTNLNTDNHLTAQSQVEADGWELETLPYGAPTGAVGYYSRGNERAYLIKTESGFRLETVEKKKASE